VSKPYIILDRDGTVIVECHYLSDPDRVELLPGAAAGLQEMAALGFGLVITTNQSAIGRGYFDEVRLADIHARLAELLTEAGVHLDGVYYCPHHPDAGCNCRKPLPGMVLNAAREHGFTPEKCVVIGDKPCDIELGHAVGARTILVRTGYGAKAEAAGYAGADIIVDDLQGAARFVRQLDQSMPPAME